jgi:hypothetical protein
MLRRLWILEICRDVRLLCCDNPENSLLSCANSASARCTSTPFSVREARGFFERTSSLRFSRSWPRVSELDDSGQFRAHYCTATSRSLPGYCEQDVDVLRSWARLWRSSRATSAGLADPTSGIYCRRQPFLLKCERYLKATVLHKGTKSSCKTANEGCWNCYIIYCWGNAFKGSGFVALLSNGRWTERKGLQIDSESWAQNKVVGIRSIAGACARARRLLSPLPWRY